MISGSFIDYIEVNPKIVFEKDKKYPFIEMSNVGIFQREPDKIDIKKFGSGTKFQKGDTVVARIEPCLQNGKFFFVKDFEEGFGSTEFLVFRSKDEAKLDDIYLYYLMQDQYIRESMIRSMTGATGRQRVNNKVFYNININIPNLHKQKKIAGILKLYDDLIENNFKRIKLLEETAELIYKEWFVNFIFPGYEKCEFVNGIPKDWKVTKISEIAAIDSGYAFKGKDFQTYGNPIIKIRNIENNSINVINCDCVGKNIVEKLSGFKLEAGDLLIAMTGATVGKIGIMPRNKMEYYLNQRVGRIKSKYYFDISSYLFCLFKSNYVSSSINNIAKGAAQPNISTTEIGNIEIVLSEENLLQQFENICSNLLQSRLNLIEQNEKLKEARDILMPKLIMGEIEV